MTPFYYYALFLTLGLFLYYVVLIAMTMYGKPKGESNTAEDIETDGVSDDSIHAEEPDSSEESDSDDNDDDSGSREWQESDEDNPDDSFQNDSLQEVNDESNEDDNPSTDSEQTPDETDNGNEDNTDNCFNPLEEGINDAQPENEEGEDENANEEAVLQPNDQPEEQNDPIDDSALGLTPALREYLKQHGAVIENTVKKVDDLDLTPPEEETDYGITEIHEPDNEDAQIIAAQANSCQEKITPKSDDEIPKGALNKMLGERLTKALEEDYETIPNNNTANNILSHNVRDRC